MMARHSLPEDLKALQDGLIRFYEKKKSCLPIAPLVEHHDAPVVDIYVLPRMMIADKPTFGMRIDDSEKIPVYKYKDLFEDQDKHQFKKIFITAGGGMGKSAFVRKMILTWCQAQRADKNIDQIDKKFQNDDIKTMKNFTFLFLLELCYSDNCDIDFMIQTLVENNIGRVSGTTLETALNKYQCLVLLDGLDKWKHQRGCSQKNTTCHEGVDMPYNKARGNVTLVTTSRPWRVIRLKANDVDRHVELSNLTRRASQQLESNVINFFEKLRNKSSEVSEVSEVKIQQDIDEFDAKMAASELEDVRCTPYILLQELCLWAEGKTIRKSKFEAYKYTIELTLEKAPKENEPKGKDKQVPDYFRSTKFCKKYYHSMLELGRLAFRMQCREIIDKSIKMTLKEAKSCVDHLDFYRTAGILSETKDHTIVAGIKTFISFQEKAFQEFFAALYMTHGWNSTSERQTIVQECLRLPNVMQMSNVLSFVGDMNTEWHGDIYNAVVKRTDLMKYISESKQKVSQFGGTFVQFDATEMKTIVEDNTGDEVTEGSFGPEYIHALLGYMLDTQYSKLCVKKVKGQKKPRKAILNTLKQELRTSKFLHPFLLSAVTLLRKVSEVDQAYTDTFYLVSPFYGDHNLYDALHGDSRMEFDWPTKIRILLQLASGIEYIYTSGTSTAVTHNGICTRNILVDKNKNIRLTWPDQNTKPVWDDYFSFGVVVMEVLTGEEPEEIARKGHLAVRDIETIKYPKDEPKFKTFINIVGELLRADGTSSSYTWTDATENLSELYRTSIRRPVLSLELCDAQKCMMCMVNPGTITKPHDANCLDKFRVCSTCELNLHFRPVKCFGCNSTLRQAIGVGWGAILVAGNDKNEQLAENFAMDLQDVKNLVTCQAPLLMGIREENVKVIQPETPGQDEILTKKLEKAIDEIKNSQDKIHTLLVYFSCHGKEQGGKLQLGSVNDLLDKSILEKWLGGLKLDKAIFFMDHCYPTNIKLAGETRTIQLNSCKSDKQTSGGSPFTKYLIEAMTEKASRGSRNSTEDAYVSATNLLERVTQLYKQNGMETEPVFYIPDSSRCKDIHIAYCNLQSVEVTFCHNTQKEEIQIDVLQTILEIRRDVCLAFEKDEMVYSVEIRRHAVRRPVNTDGTLVKEKKTENDKPVPERVDKTQDIILAHILQEKLEVVFTEFSSVRQATCLTENKSRKAVKRKRSTTEI